MTPKSQIDKIIGRVLEALEQGVRPWRKPWEVNAACNAGVHLPLRADGMPFSGMNAITLMIAGASQGYTSPYWLTYKQAKTAGGQVRRGEKSEPALLYRTRIAEAEDEDDEPQMLRYLKVYGVFCADQCDGLPETFFPSGDPSELSVPADRVLDGFEVDVRHGGDRAFYHGGFDYVQLPPPDAFESTEHYLSTKAHEFIHATGHKSRLDRDFGSKRWGDEAYAVEELVAELGSVLLCARFALRPDHLHSHAAYIDNWLDAIKSHPNALLSAASHADQAATYVLSAARHRTEPSSRIATQGIHSSHEQDRAISYHA